MNISKGKGSHVQSQGTSQGLCLKQDGLYARLEAGSYTAAGVRWVASPRCLFIPQLSSLSTSFQFEMCRDVFRVTLIDYELPAAFMPATFVLQTALIDLGFALVTAAAERQRTIFWRRRGRVRLFTRPICDRRQAKHRF
ncbi:unnamed protein product [Clavelina lepadiformis]|uniref:Uncharacterized protein n=1 Tax=Clavelina lepadiformis TaxID=159417 RepID=A0ABP0FU13_CLALP